MFELVGDPTGAAAKGGGMTARQACEKAALNGMAVATDGSLAAVLAGLTTSDKQVVAFVAEGARGAVAGTDRPFVILIDLP